MRFPLKRIAVALAGTVLYGCANDSASFLIDGREHAVTLLRLQPYFWNKKTELDLIVARFPDCQRRHKLKPAMDGDIRAELFETGPGAFVLKRGSEWYVMETTSCGLQEAAAPTQTGARPVGVFDASSGRLKFVIAATTASPR